MNSIYGYVYLITNQVDGMVYVGQTIQAVSKRWNGHRHSARRRAGNSYLHNAMNKHGVEKFTLETIRTAASKDELDRLECEAISRYDSMNRERGYNLTHGGSRGKPSELSRQRQSASHLGHVRSEESRRRQSKALKGHIGYNKGMKCSPETLRKMSEAHKGKQHCLGNKLTDEHKRNISNAVRGEKHPGYGKKRSVQTVEKMRIAFSKRKRFPCPHCKKECLKVHLVTWHGDKCKSLRGSNDR